MTENEATMKAELKPCPFCGNTDIKIRRFYAETWLTIGCKCGARIVDDKFVSKKRAIAAWNRRKA